MSERLGELVVDIGINQQQFNKTITDVERKMNLAFTKIRRQALLAGSAIGLAMGVGIRQGVEKLTQMESFRRLRDTFQKQFSNFTIPLKSSFDKIFSSLNKSLSNPAWENFFSTIGKGFSTIINLVTNLVGLISGQLSSALSSLNKLLGTNIQLSTILASTMMFAFGGIALKQLYNFGSGLKSVISLLGSSTFQKISKLGSGSRSIANAMVMTMFGTTGNEQSAINSFFLGKRGRKFEGYDRFYDIVGKSFMLRRGTYGQTYSDQMRKLAKRGLETEHKIMDTMAVPGSDLARNWKYERLGTAYGARGSNYGLLTPRNPIVVGLSSVMSVIKNIFTALAHPLKTFMSGIKWIGSAFARLFPLIRNFITGLTVIGLVIAALYATYKGAMAIWNKFKKDAGGEQDFSKQEARLKQIREDQAKGIFTPRRANVLARIYDQKYGATDQQKYIQRVSTQQEYRKLFTDDTYGNSLIANLNSKLDEIKKARLLYTEYAKTNEIYKKLAEEYGKKEEEMITARIDQIKSRMAEIDDYKKAMEEERQKRIKAQLDYLGERISGEDKFRTSIEGALDREQRRAGSLLRGTYGYMSREYFEGGMRGEQLTPGEKYLGKLLKQIDNTLNYWKAEEKQLEMVYTG